MVVYSLTTQKDEKLLGKFTNLTFLDTDDNGVSKIALLCNANTLWYDGKMYRIAGTYPNEYIKNLPIMYVGICENDCVLREDEVTNRVQALTKTIKSEEENYLSQLHDFIAQAISKLTDAEVIKYYNLVDRWFFNEQYYTGDVVKFKLNSEGKPILYRITRDHISTITPEEDNGQFYRKIN